MAWKAYDSNGSQLQMALTDLPVGTIVGTGRTTAPNNWLLCDGTAYSRTGYAELFSAIGTSYGTGDGSTTFNVPVVDGHIILASSNSSRFGINDGSYLPDNVISTSKIRDSAITTAKIAPNAVVTADIADGAVTSSKLGASSVSLSFLSAASTTARTANFGDILVYQEATITVTAGIWLVSAGLTLTNTSTTDDAYCAVYNRTGSAEVSNTMGLVGKATTTTDYQAFYSRPHAVTFAGTTDICPLGNRNGASTLRAARGAGVGQVGWITALKLTN